MHFGVHLIAFVEPAGADNQPMAAFRQLIRSADDYGFHRITTGEHSSGGRLECVAALSCMAMTARQAHIGPLVTNGVTRDIGVAAAGIASIDVLSNGHAFYILGRGNAGIRNVGLRPSTLDETRQFFLAMRDLLRTSHADFQGRDVILRWPYSLERIPLYLVAEGPMMLDLAGAIADGVYLGTGLQPEVVADSIARVRAGAAEAGRDPDALDLWWEVRCAVAENTAEARARIRESLSSVGNHALRGDYAAKLVPADLAPALREYHARYNYRRHGSQAGALDSQPANVSNADLMDELGLTDYFLERFGVVGTPEELVQRLTSLESLGITQVSLNAWGADDLRLLGEQVLPHFR